MIPLKLAYNRVSSLGVTWV